MKIPDVNVLLYAQHAGAVHHDSAREWLEREASEGVGIGWSWAVLLGFVRIATNPAIYSKPLSLDAALERVQEWTDLAAGSIVQPTGRHLEVLRRIAGPGLPGGLVADAHLAALAVEHGVTLSSFDADFHRFEELDFEYLR